VARTMIAMKLRNTVLMMMALVLVAGGTCWSLRGLMAQSNPPTPAAPLNVVAQADEKPKPADGARENDDIRAAAAAKIRSLRVARVDALKKAEDTRFHQFETGKETVSDFVLHSSRLLLAAELELAETPRDRLAALQRTLERAKAIEKQNSEKFEAGTIGPAQYHLIPAYRLEVGDRLRARKIAGCGWRKIGEALDALTEKACRPTRRRTRYYRGTHDGSRFAHVRQQIQDGSRANTRHHRGQGDPVARSGSSSAIRAES
jgi:hypothetical protein